MMRAVSMFGAVSTEGLPHERPTRFEVSEGLAGYPTWVAAGTRRRVTHGGRRIVLGVGSVRGFDDPKLAASIARDRARTAAYALWARKMLSYAESSRLNERATVEDVVRQDNPATSPPIVTAPAP